MKIFEAIAKTKNGYFKVTLTALKEASPITGMAFWHVKGSIEINGKSLPVRIERLRQDRIYATREIAVEFGVAYNDNLALSCDLSEAFYYVNDQEKSESKVMSEKENKSRHNNFVHNL